MKEPVLVCKDEQRRRKLREGRQNGLDYVEVSEDQRTLTVYFLGKAPEQISKENVRIDGGQRITGIRVLDLDIHRQDDPDLDDCMVVTVDKPGDFSTYSLCMVELDERGHPVGERDSYGRRRYRPLANFDPRYACVEFNFKAGCPRDLDCKPQEICPPPERHEPEINYLAKDYASFRQLILDRLALIMPDWQERHVPDIGIALVEVLAYVGDYLSFFQDSIGTEAYLDTAHQRISIRRHARLVDYFMHEGCNARAWLCIKTSADVPLDPKDIFFITHHSDVPGGGKPLSLDDLRNIPFSQYEAFEPLLEKPEEPLRLYEGHNRIHFYTWGDKECCLPKGATRATLRDAWVTPTKPEPGKDEPYEQTSQEQEPIEPDEARGRRNKRKKAPPPAPSEPVEPKRKLHLQPGDFLIFEEVIGPETGDEDDADRTHRHVVRLTRVTPGVDKLYDPPIPVVEVEWAPEDALPFPLCISSIGPPPECVLLEDISVACGNVILVDHGRPVDESPDPVPKKETEEKCPDPCHPAETTIIPGPFRPRLRETPPTFSQPLAPCYPPASSLFKQDPRQALPQIRLCSIPPAPDGAGPLFHPGDLKDPIALAGKLKQAKDPGSKDPAARHLRGLLSLETQQSLDQYDATGPLPEELRRKLIAELDGLLQRWTPQRDLLGSQGWDHHFVVEMDNDGRAHLRFGDGELGRRPEAGMQFLATYRVGNGLVGNVGAETISHIVFRQTTLSGVQLWPCNPLPGQGGTPPEPVVEVKWRAPHAFRKELQRAIIRDDYARLAERNSRLQRAAATLRWTGSWYEVLVAIDPHGGLEADETLLYEIKGYLHRYRRMGHNLSVRRARYVPLDIGMMVCILPNYLRGHVKAALLDIFSNRILPDGRRGFFHPDNLSFGEGIYLSRLIAAAQAVPGVESVEVTKLERVFEGANREIENGVLPLGPFEIARLDNDPSFPENGVLKLDIGGGR
jgi:hypothetical protein